MKKFFLISSILLFIILAAAPSIYFYRRYQSVKSSVPVQFSNAELVAKVGKLILLPTGEDPTIMTVTDKEKLSGQDFFIYAKNGDRVLIYEKAKKAFLYDPDADKVIEVGPIVMGSPTPSVPATASPSGQVSTPSAAPRIIIQ